MTTEKMADDSALNIDKNILATQPNPFGAKSREKSGSERKGGMPGESGIQGGLHIRINDFQFQSTESPISMVAVLNIQYAPRKYNITAEDVSMYAKQFHYFTGTAEEAIELFARHFIEQIEPMTFQLTTEFAPRDGVQLNPAASWVHPEFVRQQQRSAQGGGGGLALPPGVRPS